MAAKNTSQSNRRASLRRVCNKRSDYSKMGQQEVSLENKQSSGETKTKHGIPIDYGLAKEADEEAIQRTAVSLRERGITVDVVSSSEEARYLVRTKCPHDKTIFPAKDETVSFST